MSDSHDPRILAVTPGADALAFAVAEGERLLYYGVRTLETDRDLQLTGEQAVAAVEATIEDLSPRCLALLKPRADGSLPARRHRVINDRIRAVALRWELKTYRVAPGAVGKAVAGDPEASRGEVLEELASVYPELELLEHTDSQSSGEDVADIVESVGLARTASRV